MTALGRPALAAQLAPIRARAEAATPGPWIVHHEVEFDEHEADVFAAQNHPDDGWGPIKYDGSYAESAGYMHVTDAEFIAAARTDVPALLVIIDRLTDALDVADKASHDWGCVGWSHDHMGDYFYPSLGCDCWKADYDAAKQAMGHE